nr:HepT-like ribonuclease domain-containing protein [uncultured Albidiferax sp.]
MAFRNQLIHGYATVNVGTGWNIAQNALPTLLDAVQALLDELA